MASTSDLTALVETEARLDRAIAAAREQATARVGAARRAAAEREQSLDAELAAERSRIAREIAVGADAEARRLAEAARAHIARYERIRGDEVLAIARALAARIAELASKDSP